MSLVSDFQLMARYNQWMNARLYAATGELGDEEARADRGAFFGSILSTLEHILAADVHWMRRFATSFPELASLEPVRRGPLPELVRGITSPDFERLRAQREAIDGALVAFTLEATDAEYAAPMTYVNSAGDAFTRGLGWCCATSSTTRRITAGRSLRCSASLASTSG